MERILNINISAGIIVLCIVAARKIFIYRVPGRTWLLLWQILILRLVCPFIFEVQFINVDIYRTIANMLHLQEKIELPKDAILLSSADKIMKIIWLMGVIVIAGVFIGSHLRKRTLYCMALPVKGVYFEKWKALHSLKRKVQIKESDRIVVPLTYGLLRPVILLPAHRNIKESSLAFVLEHEFIHIKHMDILLKWILVWVCAVYWYNPLIWVMYFWVNRDVELSCDALLLKHQTQEYRKEYLRVLVNLEEKKAEREILCSSFCKYPIEERIRVMVKTGKEKPQNVLLARMMVCLIIILSIATTARAEMAGTLCDSNNGVTDYDEVSGQIPDIIGCDEGKASALLWKQGFSYSMK